jgi:hypothetical protein
MNSRLPLIIASALIAILAAPSMAAKTAFRISSLYLRDPHVFVNFIGCRDITDNQLAGFSINNNIQTSIQTDGDGDGRLDLNYVILFDPLDQAAANGSVSWVNATCLAPFASPSCWAVTATAGTYTNSIASTCLAPVVGTTHGYVPAITTASAPCFVVSVGTLTLNLGGIPVTLHDAFVGATYSGFPATNLSNGFIRGFLSESDANNTIIPMSMALIGGLPFSQLLPGGANCCAAFSDKDVNNGVVGWYFYLNFTATQVPFTDPPTAVGDQPPALTLDAPHPNPFNPSTEIHYLLPRASRVQISVYDAGGRVVSKLADEEQVKGEYSVHWDGRDARGSVVSSGVYFVRLEANGETRTQKMVLLK